jgi:hypothetical protein
MSNSTKDSSLNNLSEIILNEKFIVRFVEEYIANDSDLPNDVGMSPHDGDQFSVNDANVALNIAYSFVLKSLK